MKTLNVEDEISHFKRILRILKDAGWKEPDRIFRQRWHGEMHLAATWGEWPEGDHMKIMHLNPKGARFSARSGKGGFFTSLWLNLDNSYSVKNFSSLAHILANGVPVKEEWK